MNLTIGTATTRTWGTVKRNYITVFGAVVVAAVLTGAGINAWLNAESTTPESSASARRARIEAIRAKPSPLSEIYYLVDSEDQAAMILRADTNDAYASSAYGFDAPRHKVHALVASTPEQESEVLSMFTDAIIGEDGVQIVDLRPREPYVVNVVTTNEPVVQTSLSETSTSEVEPACC